MFIFYDKYNPNFIHLLLTLFKIGCLRYYQNSVYTACSLKSTKKECFESSICVGAIMSQLVPHLKLSSIFGKLWHQKHRLQPTAELNETIALADRMPMYS